jgi:transcriptional regulator with XRE-family HTH domain
MRSPTHPSAVDDRRVGLALRALRRRHGWRQDDLATKAGVSQGTVSLAERGHLEHISLAKLRRIAGAVEARCSVDLSWRGAAMDQLLDERHSALVESAVRLFGPEWETAVEVSFAHFAERGSVDVLAWHPTTKTLVVVEVKTELASIEEALRRFDVKVRLALEIARPRGWVAMTVARLLVIADAGATRRTVASRNATFTSALPMRGWAVRRWLRSPSGGMAGLVFLPLIDHVAGRRIGGRSHRVRVPVGGQGSARQRSGNCAGGNIAASPAEAGPRISQE